MRMLVRSKLRLNVVNGLTEFYDSRDDQLTEQAAPGRERGPLQHARLELRDQMQGPSGEAIDDRVRGRDVIAHRADEIARISDTEPYSHGSSPFSRISRCRS